MLVFGAGGALPLTGLAIYLLIQLVTLSLLTLAINVIISEDPLAVLSCAAAGFLTGYTLTTIFGKPFTSFMQQYHAIMAYSGFLKAIYDRMKKCTSS